MKLNLTHISLLIATSLMLSCATTPQYVNPANARIAATLVCTSTLNYAVKPEDRTQVANYIYAVAHGIRSLAGGTVPSPDELKATVALFTKNAQVGQWSILSVAIQQIYGGLYGNLHGNPKLAALYLEAIAAGAEDAAAPFIVHPSPAP